MKLLNQANIFGQVLAGESVDRMLHSALHGPRAHLPLLAPWVPCFLLSRPCHTHTPTNHSRPPQQAPTKHCLPAQRCMPPRTRPCRSTWHSTATSIWAATAAAPSWITPSRCMAGESACPRLHPHLAAPHHLVAAWRWSTVRDPAPLPYMAREWCKTGERWMAGESVGPAATRPHGAAL